jgi:hypothetical protein
VRDTSRIAPTLAMIEIEKIENDEEDDGDLPIVIIVEEP